MQQELIDTSYPAYLTDTLPTSTHSSNYGIRHSQPSSSGGGAERDRSRSPPLPVPAVDATTSDDLDLDQLEDRLRRLSHGSHGGHRSAGRRRSTVAGQRIVDYENALTPTTPRPAVGFKVTKRAQSPSEGVQLADFPNEILTHILSHLHPDSHAAVAIVSKRFYALVTEPHAWRMAFLRYFPGQDVLLRSLEKIGQQQQSWEEEDPDTIKSETRHFTRLTSLASWRSEYLLRTRLLRSVARGKPAASNGSAGSAARATPSGRKAGAVLTYNSKLPWTISNLHAVFPNGSKPPRVISGTSDLGVGTISDPTIGKVEKWGLDDPFSFAQLDEVFPNLDFFGHGDGPVAVPNVMDVSQPYGVLGGEGFPGGRVYYRAPNEVRGRYLGPDSAIIDMAPEIPKIPELSEAICSLWIAKSPAVPSTTQSMVGMMAGSTLGVVTTYALGYESSGTRYRNGEMTARWVLSPGVPIIALKVDDSYNSRRKALKRVWAVALNALGEVFYLRDTPNPPGTRAKGDDVTRSAWMSGRSAYWELIESTRRVAREDANDKHAVRGTYSPRSPSSAMNLSKAQIVAEAREIEKFLRHKPSHFNKACDGWDMHRKLEVDFAGGDDSGAAEGVFVVSCGSEHGGPAAVTRYTRHAVAGGAAQGAYSENQSAGPSTPAGEPAVSSLFGGPADSQTSGSASTYALPTFQPPATPVEANDSAGEGVEEWTKSVLELHLNRHVEITVSAADCSTYALMAAFEDPLSSSPAASVGSGAATPTSKQSTGEIPGRRARLLAVGTDTGAIYVWNMRATGGRADIKPVRAIQTESPEISCLALSSLCIVHGGSDSLVQAWDPLTSTVEPVRTLNAKSTGRVPRHIVNANPALRHADYSAVRAIFLDPDPTMLRGVLSFGTFIRFWTYNSTLHGTGRKRRPRQSEVHGRLSSRRLLGAVSGHIAAEEAELRREQEHRAREQDRLERRFGVGLADLTEEEAVRYAEMISQEQLMLDERRRLSASDTGSAADMGETASSTGSTCTADTATPEPSISGGPSPSASDLPVLPEETEDGFEAQMQRAIRLSLMEGDNSSGDYEFSVTVKDGRSKKKGKAYSLDYRQPGESGQALAAAAAASSGADVEDDLAMALRLSLEEEENRQQARAAAMAAGLGDVEADEFPPLEVNGKGKGKAVGFYT